MNETRLSRQEIGERGSRIYCARLPELLQAGAKGMFVAIDILSEEYEVAEEARVASERLKARNPGAQILVERIGYPAAFTALSSRASSGITADGRLGYFETVDLDVVWHGRETTVRAQVLDEAMLGTRMLKGCELVAVWNAGGVVSIRL